MKNDVLRLFPDREKEMAFHQDTASSHTVAETSFSKNVRSIKYLTPEEWMPKSPDAATMDTGIWGTLKRRLQKR
jgi:hypothetical protein